MKNKKKVLIAVAAMAAFAVGTAGVGTAAWWQASSKTGAIKSVIANEDLSVEDPHYTAATVDLPLNIRVEREGAEKTLELAHYYAAGDLNTKARAEGGTWVTSDGDSSSTFTQAAGFYKAYYKTTSKTSIVYSANAHRQQPTNWSHRRVASADGS